MFSFHAQTQMCLSKLAMALAPTLSITTRLKIPQGSCIVTHCIDSNGQEENDENGKKLVKIGETDSSV